MTPQNADNAQQANTLASEARRSADTGAESMGRMNSAIQEIQKSSDETSKIIKVLDEIVQSVGKTTDLVSEIAAASQEQAQGIDQVNTAIAQMDKVTQQNAANAEESASASEQLSAQAESMNDIVGELVALVGTSASQTQRAGKTRTRHQSAESRLSGKGGRSNAIWHQIADGHDSEKKPVVGASHSAAQSIPFDDEDAGLGGFNS